MSDKLAEFELVAPNTFLAHVTSGHRDASLPVATTRIPNVPVEEIYTFGANISNQNLDTYFTRMAESSLRNYAADAQEGVAFLNGHKHSDLPMGYSVRGVFDPTAMSVAADFYTIRGLEINGLNTDQFIKAVEADLIRDVSIGFKDGIGFAYTCSVCGLSMWDWECDHIPGMEYETVANPGADPSNQDTATQFCFVWIENARLSEVSAVFDGATPGAMLTKATREQRAGRLKPDVQRMLENRYRIQLPALRIIVPVEKPKSEEKIMPNEKELTTSGVPDNTELDAARLVAIRLRAQAAGVAVSDTDNAEQVFDKVRAELERLKPFELQAHDGKVLRAALIEETLAEGVRAFGNNFNREAKETMLAAMPVDAVKELRDAWKDMGDAIFANKGRSSVADLDDKDEDNDEYIIPEDAVGGV